MALGGAERQMAELVRRLPADRYDPILCTLDSVNAYRELLPGDQPRYVLEEGVGLAGMTRLRDILRESAPDIVHSFMEYANLWNRLLSPSAGRPVVISSVRSRMMRPDYRLIEAALATRCDRIVVNSIGTRDELVRWQRVPASKIRVLSNIVDFDRFQPAGNDVRERVRDEMGLRGPTFLIPSRISLAKHQLGLVLAASRLKGRGLLSPETTFLLAGRVFDSSVARLLSVAVRWLGVERNVRYVGSVKQIQDLYAAADWVLLPSLYEGLPNAALEAHAMERPLLMSRSANLDGIMEHDRTGIEFDTAWIGPLERALERAFETPGDVLISMGQAGRHRVLAKFDPADALDSVTDLYEELMAARNPRGGRE